MNKTKKGLYGLLLRFIRTFRIEEKTIGLLKATEGSDVKVGRMYEHYGRIFVAEEGTGDESGCGECDIQKMALPCAPRCDFKCRYRLLHERRQNATNQQQWQRMMLRRIGFRD